LKEGADINKVWLLVDERKLPDGLADLIREYQRSKQDHQKCLRQINDTVTITAPDCDVAKYPALCQFAIPLVKTSIHALLHRGPWSDGGTGGPSRRGSRPKLVSN
jgi:hypothetical protein